MQCPSLWQHYFEGVLTTKVDPEETVGKSVVLIRYIRPFKNLQPECVDHFIKFHIHLYVHRLDIIRVEHALRPLVFFTTFENEETLRPMLDVEHKPDLSVYSVNKLYEYACQLNDCTMEDWLSCFHKIVRTKKY